MSNKVRIFDQILSSRIQRFGLTTELVLPEKPLKDMTNQEIREYATFFSFVPYCQFGGISSLLEYQTQTDIVEQLNNEFDRRVGANVVSIYNLFDKKENTEKWGGELRYKILSYEFKGYTEFAVVRKVMEIVDYCNENKLPLEHVSNVLKISLDHFYWDIDTNDEANNTVLQNRLVDRLMK